ncbi:MAG: DUF1428 domain-containing protein [Marivita sp.]|uniref:DUF1428 domain-containing protein n=1 Tax=Marivita sp. TaxID=2003365 RepID=UPI0025C69945|nr:DUF1428 domain-containing protein [Marivita sp.]MCI5112148.1 DUF1428 domain-containing protein [Marivita sp.]
MPYIDGFVAAVPTDRKADYIAHAREAWDRIFAPAGALRCTEAWGDDVPDGKVTSFPMAVQCKPGETVVFSWIEWPDKPTRDACMAAMEAGEGMDAMAEMPMDGQRMIFGGFDPVLTLESTSG